MMGYNIYQKAPYDWYSVCPAHWKMLKLKHILKTHFGGCWGLDTSGNPRDLLCIRVGDFDYKNLRIKASAKTKRNYTLSQIVNGHLEQDDLILEKSGGGDKTPVGRVVLFSLPLDNEVMFSNFSECLRPDKKLVNSNYLALYLKVFYLIAGIKKYIKQTTGIQNIDISAFLNIQVSVPPRDEQDQIVRFLDWKVSTVNKLINAKRQEIKSLVELKRSMVSSVVTRGLSQNVPMKNSGVKWLGDIPAHWEIVKLRKLLHPVSEKNHPELPLLSVVREQGVIVRDVEDKETNHNYIPDDLSGYKVVRKGQFVMNKMKAWQGSYGISDYTGIVSPAYFIFDVSFDNLEYFHYAIRSKVYVNFFAQASDGIRVGQWDLQMDKMKEIPFFVPPTKEQYAIVEYIKRTMPKYNTTIEKLKDEIDLLEEYKTKLIADVVTGQIDVRDIEIPEYELVDEDVDEINEGSDNTEDEEN